MKKLSNAEVELKKSVAYKKVCIAKYKINWLCLDKNKLNFTVFNINQARLLEKGIRSYGWSYSLILATASIKLLRKLLNP